ncbi:hypothetical protein CL634_02140 [bacterium]|nr:hypothetical protein [bacterium]
MASANKTVPMTTPICEFEWVTISGDGKDDLNDVPHYWITCVFDPDRVDKENTSEKRAKEHAAFLELLEDFWEEEKPAGSKYEIKGGIKDHKVKTDELDEEGDPVYESTGKKLIVVKTRTVIENKKKGTSNPKVIKVFNAKGTEIDLGSTLIGNGSRGRVGLALTTFINKKGSTIISSGLSFYLNTVQLAKLVAYTGQSMDAIDDDELEEDEQFEGAGEMGGIEDESDSAEVPRI